MRISWAFLLLLFSGEYLNLLRLQQYHVALPAISPCGMFDPYFHYGTGAGMTADAVFPKL
jgi:hypothetical protein